MNTVDQSGPRHHGFTWPPRDAGHEDVIPATGRETKTRPSRACQRGWGSTLLAAERYWLGGDCLTIDDARRAGHWSPDAPGTYCDRCGGTNGEYEMDEFGCARCRGMTMPWARFVRLGSYEGEMARFIQELKFQRRRSRGVGLGRALADQLERAGVLDGPGQRVCVAPVPMTWRRRMARGVDHALALARSASRSLEIDCCRLLSARYRPSQRSVAASQRSRNLRGAFRLRRDRNLANWRVVLIDDVSTTGATLRAAARAVLAGAGGSGDAPEIWVASVAVTPDRDRRTPGDQPAYDCANSLAESAG